MLNFVGELFLPPPARWGLRGDPYLWAELGNDLANQELPADIAELHGLLEAAFLKATGVSLAACANVRIERLEHGGMSSGYVSGKFWREEGFPLIAERFLANRRGKRAQRKPATGQSER